MGHLFVRWGSGGLGVRWAVHAMQPHGWRVAPGTGALQICVHTEHMFRGVDGQARAGERLGPWPGRYQMGLHFSAASEVLWGWWGGGSAGCMIKGGGGGGGGGGC